MLFRVSTNYRYPLYHHRCIYPNPRPTIHTLVLFTKSVSCFLCVLVISSIGTRVVVHWLFITVFLWYLACRFHLQMAMYVISGYSVQLPPSTVNDPTPIFIPSPSIPVLFHCSLFLLVKKSLRPVAPVMFMETAIISHSAYDDHYRSLPSRIPGYPYKHSFPLFLFIIIS